MLMIRVTWHIATIVFLVMGSAMAVCSATPTSGACVGVGRISAISFASFAVLAGVLASAMTRRPGRLLVRHPGPVVFVAVAILSWVGSTH